MKRSKLCESVNRFHYKEGVQSETVRSSTSSNSSLCWASMDALYNGQDSVEIRHRDNVSDM